MPAKKSRSKTMKKSKKSNIKVGSFGSRVSRFSKTQLLAFAAIFIAIGGVYYLIASHADSFNNILAAGQTLSSGQQLHSSNGNMFLWMQNDGNLVVYTDANRAVWSSGTSGTGSSNRVVMQSDCNLVVYNSANSPLWQSGTSGNGSNCDLNMQTDGNLVVYNGSTAEWQSGTSGDAPAPPPPSSPPSSAPSPAPAASPSATLAAGHSIGLNQPLESLTSTNGTYTINMQSDCNLVLYNNSTAIWQSGTNGRGSNCFAEMQTDGNLVVYTSANNALWQSGTSGKGSSGSYLDMQTDGNLVIYNNGAAIWQSGTAGGTPPPAPVAKPVAAATTNVSSSSSTGTPSGPTAQQLNNYYTAVAASKAEIQAINKTVDQNNGGILSNGPTAQQLNNYYTDVANSKAKFNNIINSTLSLQLNGGLNKFTFDPKATTQIDGAIPGFGIKIDCTATLQPSDIYTFSKGCSLL